MNVDMTKFAIDPSKVRLGDYIVSTISTPRGGMYVTYLTEGYRYEVRDIKHQDGKVLVLLRTMRGGDIGWWYLNQFISEEMDYNMSVDYENWN